MDFAYTFVHYFFPQHSNNQKAKLIHTSTLFVLALLLVVYQLLLQTFPQRGVKILGYAANIPPDEIIRLTNVKRREAGVSDLIYSASLAQAAKAKGEHMLANDYWSHIAPDGTEPWKFFTDAGYKYRYAGENLARDFSNPNSAIEAWMASPSHKDNLLSAKYNEIGVAVVEGDLNGVETTIVVQLFGMKLIDTSPQAKVAEAGNTEALEVVSVVPTIIITPVPTTSLVVNVEPTTHQVQPTIIIETADADISGGEDKASRLHFLVSPFNSTKEISVFTTIVLLVVMVSDGVIVAKRKINRVSGRSFAHIAFLGMILTVLLIARAGEIL